MGRREKHAPEQEIVVFYVGLIRQVLRELTLRTARIAATSVVDDAQGGLGAHVAVERLPGTGQTNTTQPKGGDECVMALSDGDALGELPGLREWELRA